MEFDEDYNFDLDQALEEEEQIYLEDPLLGNDLKGYDDDEMETIEGNKGVVDAKLRVVAANDQHDDWVSDNFTVELSSNFPRNKTKLGIFSREDIQSQSL